MEVGNIVFGDAFFAPIGDHLFTERIQNLVEGGFGGVSSFGYLLSQRHHVCPILFAEGSRRLTLFADQRCLLFCQGVELWFEFFGYFICWTVRLRERLIDVVGRGLE